MGWLDEVGSSLKSNLPEIKSLVSKELKNAVARSTNRAAGNTTSAPQAVQVMQSTQASFDMKKYLPFAIGGAVLLLVLIMRKR